MIVREHVWINTRCHVCGALKDESGNKDERTCLPREDHIGKLAPEPKRREYASEAWDAISARIAEIRKEAQLTCPITTGRPLHLCLRMAAKCPSSCRYERDWIGPDPE